MRLRWLIGMAMVGFGVIAASWGLFDVIQIGECGGDDGSPPCPPEALAPIGALVVGLGSAILGAIFARSGRLFVALFGLLLTTGSLAVYLSLFGPGAEAGVVPVEAAKVFPAGLGALGGVLLLVAMKPVAPRISGGRGSGNWGDGSWDSGGWGDSGDSGGDSGCSSGCGGGCGGGGD